MSFKKIDSLNYEIENVDISISLSSLEEGSNITRKHIVYKDEELIKVFNRKCDHNNGKLCNLDGKIVCPMHGWEFNPQTSSYTNVQVIKTEEDFEILNDSIVVKSQNLIPELPSSADDYELSVELLSHACLLFKAKDFSFATDPWIEGFAFSSGWWTAQLPPKLWEEKLNSVDFIYVSHNHPDHLNEFTLEKIRKDMNFIVPAFQNDSVKKLLKRLGFKNITSFDLTSYYQFQDTNLFFSILKSGDFREDSGFYFTYGNFSCLSSVDSNDLNFSRLPKNISMYCSSFAGGASGFPICFTNIDELQKPKIIERNRKAIKTNVKNQIALCNASYFLPYAGFFQERASRDSYVKDLNNKNTTSDYVDFLTSSKVQVLDTAKVDSFLFHGEHLQEAKIIPRYKKFAEDPETFYKEKFSELNISDSFIKDFFLKSKFKDNLLVYFDLTNNDFSKSYNMFIVDFRDDKTKIDFTDFNWNQVKKDDNLTRLLNLKVRRDSFNWVIKNNIPFEDLSIGFQCRIERFPDIYNVKFWDHFTNIYI
jgi:CMP-N-acetylneuraminate monooxygenase